MTRPLYWVASALSLLMVVAASLVDATATWLATPITALVAVLTLLAAATVATEVRQHLRRKAINRHPSQARQW